ncbi:helix-turn-helix domain-containing protein [Nonomuraea sp. NPDC050547]|uniref:helix-turn-helix domain-containing protein n=1 Tax=unclassified Nonomuraea TaxID=2593643 RepID=UPI003483DFDB
MSHVQSVSKAACVLRTLAGTQRPLSVRELAGRTGIPRSTVHALCTTMCREGLVEAEPGEGYRLGTLGRRLTPR